MAVPGSLSGCPSWEEGSATGTRWVGVRAAAHSMLPTQGMIQACTSRETQPRQGNNTTARSVTTSKQEDKQEDVACRAAHQTWRSHSALCLGLGSRGAGVGGVRCTLQVPCGNPGQLWSPCTPGELGPHVTPGGDCSLPGAQSGTQAQKVTHRALGEPQVTDQQDHAGPDHQLCHLGRVRPAFASAKHPRHESPVTR